MAKYSRFKRLVSVAATLKHSIFSNKDKNHLIQTHLSVAIFIQMPSYSLCIFVACRLHDETSSQATIVIMTVVSRMYYLAKGRSFLGRF